MKVLVAVASKHGSTAQIGQAIAAVLEEHGLETDPRDPAAVESVEGYDAVVLGGAVYADRWMSQARALAERLTYGLSQLPVYIFASGPIGTADADLSVPTDISEVGERVGARCMTMFGGRIDTSELGSVERAVVRMTGVEEGDFRDLAAVREWADQIAADLISTPHRGGQAPQEEALAENDSRQETSQDETSWDERSQEETSQGGTPREETPSSQGTREGTAWDRDSREGTAWDRDSREGTAWDEGAEEAPRGEDFEEDGSRSEEPSREGDPQEGSQRQDW